MIVGAAGGASASQTRSNPLVLCERPERGGHLPVGLGRFIDMGLPFAVLLWLLGLR